MSSSPIATALGAAAQVQGDLRLDQDAVIAGKVTGSVHSSAHIELTPDAIILGDLHAESLRSAGRVGGKVSVQNTTELLVGSVIEGALHTGHLLTAQGVVYKGQLQLHCPAEEPEAEPAAPGFALNRTRSRQQIDLADVEQSQTTQAPFQPVPGAVNAGLRPRRRMPNAS
ncbi:bactofilin family protein [Algisphaera agarilytica]|uniref:Cytoskeletal protein CcmA (Bactofilin family) n=1 Tax=Algisphaera agarilytica TaxID=1385975 RepID=A0A7X0H7W1_9BACT|nr:polymer-forming cytoskeletal protein [Algisphaera agarilytica]MBB6430898.1 cytoskeletal protein CcmA (bactofilin family) [Algisphaera agarilytica]